MNECLAIDSGGNKCSYKLSLCFKKYAVLLNDEFAMWLNDESQRNADDDCLDMVSWFQGVNCKLLSTTLSYKNLSGYVPYLTCFC